MKYLLGLLALLLCVPIHAEDWAGLSPDCWSEPRNLHAAENNGPWQSNVAIELVKTERPKPGVYSPNKSYYFVSELPAHQQARVTIYAEKDYLIQISFTDLYALAEPKWINEKLLFMRAWWGRVAGTDLIYDVEWEKVTYAETVTDGGIAFSQYRQSCPDHGCECIKKQ